MAGNGARPLAGLIAAQRDLDLHLRIALVDGEARAAADDDRLELALAVDHDVGGLLRQSLNGPLSFPK